MGLEEVIRRKHSGDNEHMEFIFSEEKKIIVTAPAGCGKTTAMISKIACSFIYSRSRWIYNC